MVVMIVVVVVVVVVVVLVRGAKQGVTHVVLHHAVPPRVLGRHEALELLATDKACASDNTRMVGRNKDRRFGVVDHTVQTDRPGQLLLTDVTAVTD
jgi:hypothetical protein